MNKTLIYTPYIAEGNNFGYQPKYLGKISNYRSVQEVPVSEDVEEEPVTFTPTQDTQEQNTFVPQRYTPKPGFENSHQKFIQWYRQSGAPENEMDFWSRIAQDESGFIPDIQNSMGYNAFGLFGMLEGDWNGKNMTVVSTYSGAPLSVFLQNPILQIQAAQNMKNDIMHKFTDEDIAKAREMGYTDSALVAGAWAGGIGGVRKWLHKGKNAVDIMLKDSKDQDRRWAASVAGRMEALNGYFKKGGVLKFSTGGGFERYIENNRDHINNIYSRITGWGVGDIGYKDTLTTYKRNPLNQLFASPKDDKTAFSEKHFDNVRRYISDKVDSSKLTNDVLYDIFLDFDKYDIKDLGFTQRQDLIDKVMSTSKKSYLNTLAKREIFYALEGLYGSSHIKKGRFGLKMESPETDNLDLFGMSEYHGYTPTWDDLYNFTTSYETFNPKVYWLEDDSGNKQELIGHGIALSRVNPDVAKRWRANGISEEESLEWMRNEYANLDALFGKTIKNYKNLPMELRVPILDAAYNTSGSNFFTKSKNLRKHIENGDHYVTIAAELDHSMNHSADENDKNLGSWLAVRSAARRAMALGEYDYNWQHKDKYGRHILPGKSGSQDWKFSPYYNKYKNLKTKHAIYFR